MTTPTNRVKILEGLRRRNRLKARRKSRQGHGSMPGLVHRPGVLHNVTSGYIRATVIAWGDNGPDYSRYSGFHVDLAPGEVCYLGYDVHDNDVQVVAVLPGHQDLGQLLRPYWEASHRSGFRGYRTP